MKPTHGAHTSNTYIGAHIERVEDYRFLRGEGSISTTFPARDNGTPPSCAARSRMA